MGRWFPRSLSTEPPDLGPSTETLPNVDFIVENQEPFRRRRAQLPPIESLVEFSVPEVYAGPFDFIAPMEDPRRRLRRNGPPPIEVSLILIAELPALPDVGWCVADALALPPRRVARQTPALEDFLVLEDLFAPPPVVPDWIGEPDLSQTPRRRRRAPQANLQTEELAWLPPDLFGSIDFHPAYSHVAMDLPQRRLRRRKSGEDFETLVIPSSLFVDPTPFVWAVPSMDEPPRRPQRPPADWHAPIDVLPAYRFLGPDSLRFYLSGADADGGLQTDPNAALGSYRSATEMVRTGWIQLDGIDNLTVAQASAFNGADGAVGSLSSTDADSVSYAAPGSETPGDPVFVAPGTTQIAADGDDPSKFVRVTRALSGDLAGSLAVEFDEVFGSPIGMDLIESDGGDRYRAVILRNDADATITDLRIWIEPDPVAIPCPSVQTPLVAASTGALVGPTDSFLSWPTSGFVRIEHQDGTLREISYYFVRTAHELGFLGQGRGMLGTTAGPGASSDVLRSVPGIRIAWEDASPIANGPVQTIADAETAPTGVAWSTAVDADDAIVIPSLQSQRQGALWIHRQTPDPATAISRAANRILVRYTIEGQTYTERLAGLYRVRNTDLARYELYLGAGAPPDSPNPLLDPTATSATLPLSVPTVLLPNVTYYAVTQRRNEFNLVSDSKSFAIFRRDGGTGISPTPPTAPSAIRWAASAGGTFDLVALYFLIGSLEQPLDFNRSVAADAWLVYLRTDGPDPDPSIDVPLVVPMTPSGGVAQLRLQTVAYAEGTIAKVIVRSRRTGSPNVDSTNVDVYTATATATGGAAPQGSIHWRRSAQEGPSSFPADYLPDGYFPPDYFP